MVKSERRDIRRLAISTSIKISVADGKGKSSYKAYLLETTNLTQKGLFFKTKHKFKKGTPLLLEIALPPDPEPIHAEGKVAWIAVKAQKNYYPGIGIELTTIKRGDATKLREFLKEKFRNYRHALELKRMYIQLKEMAARLCELGEDHPQAKHFRKVIDGSVIRMDSIAHILDKEVWEIKSL
ncbi:MAG: PilZ domain-containing protein [Candidatus Omnitrophota bacterium]